MKLRAAVVGTGFGCRVHVPALRAAGFEVVAIVGRDPARTMRRAERSGVTHGCSTLAQALELGLDAVTVATPPYAHAPAVLEALSAGCHVLCEKPFAMDTREAEEMDDARRRAGVVGLVGHEFRFAPGRALVSRLLAQGSIGSPRLAVLTELVSLMADPALPAPDWWRDPTRGGGWLGASGSHAIDQVRHWFGEIAEIDGLTMSREDRADDSFVVRLGMAEGCVVEVIQSASVWGPFQSMTTIVGSRGCLRLDGQDVTLADSSAPEGRPVPAPADLGMPPVTPTSADARHRFTHLELGPYTRLCEDFSWMINGRVGGRAATFADGVAVQKVLDTVRRRGLVDLEDGDARPGGRPEHGGEN